MKKTAIIYASTHHGNTLKLVDAICQKYSVTRIDARVQQHTDLTEYQLIGFASGIEFGKCYDAVERFLKENLPQNRQVFFLYTCASVRQGFTRTLREEARKKQAVILGEYGCKGFNTYGPWKLIGGMNKGHPSAEEIADAVRFFESLLES